MRISKDIKSFLDPEVAGQIKDLSLRARLIVEGFLVGYHRSPYHGFSVEFKEHREYNPGDDLKWLDWKVLARTERLFVKKFEEETNLRSYILLDVSGSMNYPEQGVSKFKYALNLTAALLYLFFLQRDALGLAVFDEKLRFFVEPKTSKRHLYNLFEILTKLEPSGKTKPYKPIINFAERIKKRSMVVVFSDFLTEPDPFIKVLSYLRHRKHEVIVFQILSKQELELPGKGPSVFRDIETGARVALNPTELKDKYQKKIRSYLENLKWSLRGKGIDYELFMTNESYERALLFYLKKRTKLP